MATDTDDGADRNGANESDDAAVGLTPQGLALGIGVGLAIGASLGVATDDVGLWLPVGLGIGVALGAAFSAGLADGE